MQKLENNIYGLLSRARLTLGAVESATGGLISHRLTNVPGISEWYKGSITAYANETKVNAVGVQAGTIAEHGAVSPQVAEEMASGGRRSLNVDICISDTGIAGPGGATPGKPVGLFYLGLAYGETVLSRRCVFCGSREEIKNAAAEACMSWLIEYLKALETTNEFPEKHVVTCFLECRRKILLLKRSNKVGSFQGRWAGVSGYIEHPADEQSLIEIAEETGLGTGDVTLIRKGKPLVLDDPEMQVRWVIHPYLYRTISEGSIKTDWEHCDKRWVKPEELADYDTVPMLKEALMSVLVPGPSRQKR